jgi:hypothetical protein
VILFAINWTPLLEVNSVEFVNDPDNWTISNRDVLEPTSELLPLITIFVFWRNTCSSEEFIVLIDTHDLAVAY